jgi:hypothetical protein
MYTNKFKSGELYEKHAVATGVLGTISAFAFRHRETKKHLCRGGRSQDLPDTDFYPAIRQLKYVRQQYTHNKTIHRQ